MRLSILLLVLAGCAAVDSGEPTREQEALRRELAGRIAGPPESCVPTNGASSLRIVDRRTITYERGRTLWVNALPHDCPGLRPLDPLIVIMDRSAYCRGDRIRSLAPYSTIPGPTCMLGRFTPYRRP
jgi:hypothetical protein